MENKKTTLIELALSRFNFAFKKPNNFFAMLLRYFLKAKNRNDAIPTFINLIHSQHPYGMTVNGVGGLQEGDKGLYRWFSGSETILRFKLPQEKNMQLCLDFYNTFPNQSISVIINGHVMESFNDIHPGARIKKRYSFEGHASNEIVLQYKKTNKSLKLYPDDARDLAAIFFEFKVLFSDVNANRHLQRFDLSSITYLGSPLKNARLNREEYEKGRTILRSLPSVVTLALTTYCNNKIPCLICDRVTRNRVTDCDISEEIINSASPLLKTAMYVLLHSGGEAMLSRHYDKLIKEINPPTRVSFATNAMLMTPKRADLMLERDIMAGIVISLDAATPEMYRLMRPGSNFETVIKNVAYYIDKAKSLNRHHSNVDLNMTLCNSNIMDVPKLVDLAKKIGARSISYTHLNIGLHHKVQTVEGWEWDYVEQMNFKNKELHDDLLFEAYTTAKKNGIVISLPSNRPYIGKNAEKYNQSMLKTPCEIPFQESQGVKHWDSRYHHKIAPHIPLCFKPWQEIAILPDGATRICCFHGREFYIGYLRMNNFMNIWNSDVMVATREQFLAHGVARVCVESQPCPHRPK
ncbi:MAG TPA: radical SAM protein [Candidatus Omnitrophota bacterium]|nr:radical SAM protein [Candidatus Omnitrophota bacterium]